MSYQEPGTIVRREDANSDVVIQSADQDPVIVGELYEVFDEAVAATSYDATTGAGAQVIAWPGKKAASIVDLGGIRDGTATPDSQLLERATYPLVVKLRDPVSLVESVLDLVVDVSAVGQAGFTIKEASASATAKASGAAATAAEDGKIRLKDGGFIAANVKIGDKVRVVLPNTGGGPTTLRGEVSSVTDREVGYSTDGTPIVDDPSVTGVDGDAVAVSGQLSSTTGGFTADVTAGDRIAFWVEEAEVDDGNGTTANTIATADGLDLSDADVGRKVTIGSAVPGDGAVTAANGVANGTNTVTSASILAAHVGRVIKLSGGTGTLADTYRRIVTAGAGTCTVSGAVIPTGTTIDFTIFMPVTRNIATVVSANQFTYDGADLSDVLQVDIPVILHEKVLRDVLQVNSDNVLSYSGTGLESGTGFLVLMPFDVFSAEVTYQIFADFDVLVSYRALDTTLANSTSVTKASEVSALGDGSKYNPLLFAANMALRAMGTTNRKLVLIGVNPWQHQDTPTGLPGDKDVASAYSAAYEVLAEEQGVYSIAPLTRNSSARSSGISHVNAKSAPEEKGERSIHLTYDLPMGVIESSTGGIEPGLDGGNKKILDPGQDFVSEHGLLPGKSVVILSPAAFAGTYVVDGDTDDDQLVLEGANWPVIEEFEVTDGDFDATSGFVSTVTANAWAQVDIGDWLVAGGQYRRVTSKTSSLRLGYAGVPLTGTGATVAIVRSYLSPNEPVVYYADPLTKTQQAEALAAISQGIANFRCVNYWPDTFMAITGQDQSGNDVVEELDSFYLAAAEMARDLVLPPQNSSTGLSIPGPTGLLHSNRYFDRTQLNIIANGGWSIFVQPTKDGSVIMRHLLSTDRSTVKRSEFSVTKNIDNRAKVTRKTMDPNLTTSQGRVNITERLLDSLMLPLQAVHDFFVAQGQLVVGANGEEPYVISRLYQNPEALDQILTEVACSEPVPGNILDITFVI